MATVCGVDFGTSNSVLVTISGDNPPKIIKSAQGDTLHASAIYYPPKSSDKPVVGKAALSYLPSENVIVQPKRAIGQSFKSLKERGFLNIFNAKVFVPRAAQVDNGKAKFVITVDGKNVQKKVETVIFDMLKNFVELVNNDVGDKVSFVFSRPQFWGCDQTSTFKKVVHEASGANPVVDIITEPMGGQFAYAEKQPAKSKVMMIVDLGAGTYDLSMLREKSSGNYIGITTGGDDLLGGSNVEIEFLRTLEGEMMKIETFKKDVFDQQKSNLLVQLKEIKHNLSMGPPSKLMVYGCTDNVYEFQMSREKMLDVLTEPFYNVIKKRTNEMFERRTSQSTQNLTAEQLKKQVEVIFPIGGPHRDPYIIDQVIKPMFPKAEIIGRPGTTGALNPDEVVGLGNAMWCAAKMETPTAKRVGLPVPVHLNVLSKSIGVEGVSREDGKLVSHFCVVLPANTQLPTCKQKEGFSTSVPNQKFIRISVFQGDGRLTGDEGMQSLGSFSIPMDTPNEVDGPMINVEMEVTSDNILIVRAGEEDKMLQQKFDEVH